MSEKVLVLTFEFAPHPGGIATYSYQIAANFHAMGVPVVVLARPSVTRQDDFAFDERQPFPIYRFRRWGSRPLKIAGRITETILLCWRQRIKWIYCCSYPAAYAALACKFFLGIPYFLVGYGSEYTDRSKAKSFVMGQASNLFAISEYTANLMRSQCNHPVTVIPLGADTNQFDPDYKGAVSVRKTRERYDIEGDPILLSVGRLNPRKGHDITLRALPRIKKEHPNVQLVIIGRSMQGEEAYEAELYSFIERMNLVENVKVISMVSPDELKAFYDLAEVFILSSRNYRGDVEGFGIVLIEANLMRTPVVASRSGGIVNAVEDGRSGFLYQCEDPDDLADKVLYLLGNKDLRFKIGDYGRERALKEFNWQTVAEKTLEAVRTVLS